MKSEKVREQAFRDYQEGMKYKEIAEKYGVSLSTVKSWASRYWKKGCNLEEKKLQPKGKKVATKEKSKRAVAEDVGQVLENADLGGLSFGQDADGNWGYKAGGADTVTPFKGDPDFDYEHGISIPYVVAAGNPNVLHYYTMTAEDAAYSYLALFAVTAGSVVSIELSGVSGPSIVCNKPGGSYSFALIANPVLNGKVNFRHGGTGDGHVYKLMIK